MSLPLAAVLAFCTACGVIVGWAFVLGVALSVILGLYLSRRSSPLGA